MCKHYLANNLYLEAKTFGHKTCQSSVDRKPDKKYTFTNYSISEFNQNEQNKSLTTSWVDECIYSYKFVYRVS